ncbi:hypothetical protein [Flammeovirga sp. EKP202]|uniref:hypothetical protein n=1 Tax=Flammeovirga sp. EKP202 TaxID=2770592 RepID=UPI001CB7F9AE|nr:hypothetical protein [Flammeovirga sp. EKP202]
MMSPEVPIIILILSIPVYFVCLWSMKKLNIGTIKNRKKLALIPTVIVSPIVYVGLILTWIASVSYYPSRDFTQSQWNANVEQRYELSEDIIQSKMLIGKSLDEVITVLGTGYLSKQEDKIIYELGFVPALFGIDPDFLEIKLNNGIVVSVRQYQG